MMGLRDYTNVVERFYPADRLEPEERTLRWQRRSRRKPSDHRLPDRDRQAQRRQPARMALRRVDQAYQALADSPRR